MQILVLGVCQDQLLLGIHLDLPLVEIQVLGVVVQGLMWCVVEASRGLEQLLDVVCVVGFVGSEVSVG